MTASSRTLRPTDLPSQREEARKMALNQDPSDRLIVALDVDSEAGAMALVHELAGEVRLFKVGLELISSSGHGIVRRIVDSGGQVMLDPKLHDIPNTIRGAARALSTLPIFMLTVHASGGGEMLRAAVRGAGEAIAMTSRRAPIVLGVTVLTSIDRKALNSELGVPGTPEDQAIALAELCASSGVDGVVAAPQEVGAIRSRLGPDFVIVAPGVRPEWAAKQDQKRVGLPRDTIIQGADYLVVGRPITSPPADLGGPKEAARLVIDEISAGLEAAGGD
jgi:orotidine-5'-phosphate decarboxylase